MLNAERFDDVDNPVLRAFNRTITALTIHEEDGAEATEAYLESFDDQDKKSIAIMLMSYRKDPVATKEYVRGVAYEATN